MIKYYNSLILSMIVGLLSVTFHIKAHNHSNKALDLKTIHISELFYVLKTNGGNVLVMNGNQGTLMIDDSYSKFSKEILNEIKKNKGDVPRFLINTHFHADHTGGNGFFGELGSNIVAHENVYKQLKKGSKIETFNLNTPPKGSKELPIISFKDKITFHFNNTDIAMWHVQNAHTDGDSVVYFEKYNILHTGDLFFNTFYPFIDKNHGGSLKGMIDANNSLLDIIDDQTVIVPGHGKISNKKELESYIDGLTKIYTILKEMKDKGMTVTDIISKKPLSSFEKDWGGGFIKADKWINIVYDKL